jgi:methyl-accepting chemotaxis protein
MPALRDLRISRKFGYAFGAVCLLTALLGLSALLGFFKVGNSVGVIANNSMPSIKVLGDIRYAVATIRRTDALLLLCDSDACTQRLVPKRKSYISAYDTAMEKYAPMISSPAERELYGAIRQNAATYIALSDQAKELTAAGKATDASHLLLLGDAVKAYNAAVDALISSPSSSCPPAMAKRSFSPASRCRWSKARRWRCSAATAWARPR